MSKHLSALKNILKVTKDAPILFEASNGKAYVASHSEQTVLCAEFDEVGEDYSFHIKNDTARQIIRSCDDRNFSFSVSGSVATFKSRGVSLKLPTTDDGVFSRKSLMKKYSTSKDIKVDGALLSSVITNVKHAANDKSIGDVVLKGYHMTVDSGRMELMATNGAILSVSSLPVETKLQQTFLLNQDFHQVSQLLYGETIIGAGSDSLSLTFNDDSNVTYMLVTSLVSGLPVNYSPVVVSAEKNPHTLALETKDFYEALRRIEFFTDENKNNRVTLSLTADEVALSSNNDNGESSVRISPVVSSSFPPTEISLSLPHLVGFLASVKDDEVEVRLKDETSPILLSSQSTKDVMVLFYN